MTPFDLSTGPDIGWQDAYTFPGAPGGGAGPGRFRPANQHTGESWYVSLWDDTWRGAKEFVGDVVHAGEWAWNGAVDFEHRVRMVYHAIRRAAVRAPAAIVERTGFELKELASGFIDGLLLMMGVLGLSTSIGGAAGAALGALAGGVGAVPGAAAGAELGFDAGMFLLTWMGLYSLAKVIVRNMDSMLRLAKQGVQRAWRAGDPDRGTEERDLDSAARSMAAAVGEFFVICLEAIVAVALADATASSAMRAAKSAGRFEELVQQAEVKARIQALVAELRNSRLGAGFASWVERNIGTLIQRFGRESGQLKTDVQPVTGTGPSPGQPSAAGIPPPKVPSNPYNVSTARMTAAERQAVIEYAQRSNAWLADNGPVTVQSTAGTLRSQASAAARIERLNAARAGTPYLGQAGHVPDTALTGLPDPPAGWLDMPGTSNNAAGGGLASRIGQPVDIITVDGKVP